MSNLLNKKLAGATLPALQQVFDAGSASDKASFQASVSGERYTGLTALQALALASTRRVDVVHLGDSNGDFGGYGFSNGLEKALAGRFGIYASGVTGGSKGGVSHWSYGGLTATNAAADASAVSPVLSDQWAISPDFHKYGFIPSGSAFASNCGGVGLIGGAFPTAEALRGWFAYGVDASWTGGSFNPGARLGDTPFTSLGTVGSISTTSEALCTGLRLAKLDIAANPSRTGSVEFRPQIPSASVTGPWIFYYARAEVVNRTSGISFHSLVSAGGQSAWNFANYLRNTSDNSLTNYFAEVRRLQISAGYSPIVVVYINTAVNDRNETNTPSLGPGRVFGTGDTPAEYIDNLRGIKNRIMRIWEINRWPLGELHWWYVPSHRIADPDDAELVAYRAAVAANLLPDGQSSMTDLGGLMTYAAANAAGWYDAGGSVHMTPAGYDGVSALLVGQIP